MSKNDCGFARDENWFRFRACAIIIEDGQVLMAKNESEPYCYSVGGGVHLHETSEEAVCREVLEETGIAYEVDRLAFVHENFFTGSMTNKNQKCHEVAFYYLMKPKGIKEIAHQSYSLGGVKENMVWLPIKEFGNYHAYPTFFKDELLNLTDKVKHIITIE